MLVFPAENLLCRVSTIVLCPVYDPPATVYATNDSPQLALFPDSTQNSSQPKPKVLTVADLLCICTADGVRLIGGEEASLKAVCLSVKLEALDTKQALWQAGIGYDAWATHSLIEQVVDGENDLYGGHVFRGLGEFSQFPYINRD